MKRVNVGLLGAGICANTFHFPALQQLSDKFNIVAIAGSDPAQNDAYAKKVGTTRIYNNFQELIQDPEVEAVISSFPYFMNADIVTAAKAEGKHILVEKPIAESIRQGNYIASIDDGTIVMGVAENWLYWDVISIIRREIESGAIGKPMTVQLFSYYNIDLDNQYLRGKAWRRTATGGMILDRTIHTVALARGIFGPVEKVTGSICGIRSELGKTDTMSALIEYANGVQGTIITCASAPGVQMPYNMIIVGTKGSISVSDILTKVSVSNASGTSVFTADNGDGGYYKEFEDFYNAIVRKTAFKSDCKGASNDLFTVMTPLEIPEHWCYFNEGKSL